MATDTELQDLSKSDLVDRAKGLGLPHSGTKAELIDAIVSHRAKADNLAGERLDDRASDLDIEGRGDMSADEKREAVAVAEESAAILSAEELAGLKNQLRELCDYDLGQVQSLVFGELARRVAQGKATVASINTAEARANTEQVGINMRYSRGFDDWRWIAGSNPS